VNVINFAKKKDNKLNLLKKTINTTEFVLFKCNTFNFFFFLKTYSIDSISGSIIYDIPISFIYSFSSINDSILGSFMKDFSFSSFFYILLGSFDKSPYTNRLFVEIKGSANYSNMKQKPVTLENVLNSLLFFPL
jgi:hypothetical protein